MSPPCLHPTYLAAYFAACLPACSVPARPPACLQIVVRCGFEELQSGEAILSNLADSYLSGGLSGGFESWGRQAGRQSVVWGLSVWV